MGCCFSGDKDAEKQGVVNERSPLLSGEQSAPIPNNHRPREDGAQNGSTPLSKTDEQSMLNKILHQTANKVIDVQSTEPHSLERTEYMERTRLYLSKMSNVNTSQVPKGKNLPQGVNVPNAVLAANPVSIADIKLTITASKGAQASLSGFQIEHREPLVVSFGST
ncbi:ragulator complex protein LAMTOR1 [Exaiptasia diaphana]|uniref:Ragulator complex protein LAMTOR1 n=1 Tax=Exaiptasia diaphana TaxID=2652724 RepID=A0A913XM20_EXADI|nr:ragulator complex protein LAMTOR1 [Exaiptasia diaphana]KXJ10687.1 Ragulator complex protein LAMTOR1 [Exaiptasia diaphana]